MNSFKRIEISSWRQFDHVDISFDKRVTVLTGQNGAGKTTILNVLGKHFGWNINFVSTPFIGKKSKKKFWSDVLRLRKSEIIDGNNIQNNTIEIGKVTYNDNSVCKIVTSKFVQAQYQLQFHNQRPVIGLHIPSHRPAISYQPIQNIPTNPKTEQQQYQEFQQLLLQTYGAQSSRNPGMILKQSLVSLALFGYGNEAVIPNENYKKLFLEFQKILQNILPPELGFQRLEIRMPDVVLITETGEFSLDAMSGGINDIFAMAWQIHMYGADKDDCTVIIDEPENHLHPSMQRSFLPSMALAFPKYKFIVATHSPFVVSSMPEADVYALVYKNKRVVSLKIEEADLSGTPNKILREILDVRSNLPIWVENRISDVIKNINELNLSSTDKAKLILEELDKLGISDQISEFFVD